jgi:hypothetical protein
VNRWILALAMALFAPAASADHWDDDTPAVAYFGDSTCSMGTVDDNPQCAVAYACTGGSPPQVVDTALHCAGRLAAEREDIAASLLYYAWTQADSHTLALHNGHEDRAAMLQPTADEFNTFGCAVVWSFFCANPVIVPADLPANDPVNGYPSALP